MPHHDPLPPIVTDVRPGETYRHRKGGVYDVLAIARVEATHEPVVVYRAQYGDRDVWTRPLAEFLDGRFVLIPATDALPAPGTPERTIALLRGDRDAAYARERRARDLLRAARIALARVQSAAGVPDKGDALRAVLAVAGEALAGGESTAE